MIEKLYFEQWRLKKQIARHGLTRKKLAGMMGLTGQTFSKKMQGIVEWRLSDIQKLKEYLPNANIAEIFHI